MNMEYLSIYLVLCFHLSEFFSFPHIELVCILLDGPSTSCEHKFKIKFLWDLCQPDPYREHIRTNLSKKLFDLSQIQFLL